MNKAEYYSLPTVRNLRGKLKRRSRQFVLKKHGSLEKFKAKVTIIFRDEDEANILKTRRIKNRVGIISKS